MDGDCANATPEPPPVPPRATVGPRTPKQSTGQKKGSWRANLGGKRRPEKPRWYCAAALIDQIGEAGPSRKPSRDLSALLLLAPLPHLSLPLLLLGPMPGLQMANARRRKRRKRRKGAGARIHLHKLQTETRGNPPSLPPLLYRRRQKQQRGRGRGKGGGRGGFC